MGVRARARVACVCVWRACGANVCVQKCHARVRLCAGARVCVRACDATRRKLFPPCGGVFAGAPLGFSTAVAWEDVARRPSLVSFCGSSSSCVLWLPLFLAFCLSLFFSIIFCCCSLPAGLRTLGPFPGLCFSIPFFYLVCFPAFSSLQSGTYYVAALCSASVVVVVVLFDFRVSQAPALFRRACDSGVRPEWLKIGRTVAALLFFLPMPLAAVTELRGPWRTTFGQTCFAALGSSLRIFFCQGLTQSLTQSRS